MDDPSAISIQVATQDDFAAVARQLERRNSGFYSNINIIKKQHLDGELLVAKRDKLVVGFMSYDDGLSPCTMEVWEEHRGVGIGRELYEGFLAATYSKRDRATVLEVLCAPSFSKHFWAKMGFQTQYNENGENRMFKLIVKPELYRRHEDIRVEIYRPGQDTIFSAVENAQIDIDKSNTTNVWLKQPMVFFYQGHGFDKSEMLVRLSSETSGEVLFENYLLSEEANDIHISCQPSNSDLFVFDSFEIYANLKYEPKPPQRTGMAP